MGGAEERDGSARALGRLIASWRTNSGDVDGGMATMSGATFRATVAERLRSLEREVAEVRSRVNGLLFVVVGAVVTQLVLRIAG